MFYILHRTNGGDLALWWRANRAGYTTSLDQAGKYDEAAARDIEGIRGTDHAIECERADAVASRCLSIETANRLCADGPVSAARKRDGGRL